MGNGTLTITWASGAPIVCTISANKLKTFITKNVKDHGAIKYRLPKDLKANGLIFIYNPNYGNGL